VSRILIYEPRPDAEDPILQAGAGHDVVVCHTREALLDALAVRRPDLLVYVLEDQIADIAVLSLVRRMSADLPIILLSAPAGLEARRSVQELKPTYYGVFPLEPTELRDAVRGALDHHGRAAVS
jgi:DNA-binding response OmpR family regulator